MLDKAERINLLADIYRPLLSPHQQDLLHLSYGEDYSLAEIAEEYSISRQAVHSSLQRSIALLEEWEAKLGFLEREMHLAVWVAELEALSANLSADVPSSSSQQKNSHEDAARRLAVLAVEARKTLFL